jgi:hypothetical protein
MSHFFASCSHIALRVRSARFGCFIRACDLKANHLSMLFFRSFLMRSSGTTLNESEKEHILDGWLFRLDDLRTALPHQYPIDVNFWMYLHFAEAAARNFRMRYDYGPALNQKGTLE